MSNLFNILESQQSNLLDINNFEPEKIKLKPNYNNLELNKNILETNEKDIIREYSIGLNLGIINNYKTIKPPEKKYEPFKLAQNKNYNFLQSYSNNNQQQNQNRLYNVLTSIINSNSNSNINTHKKEKMNKIFSST